MREFTVKESAAALRKTLRQEWPETKFSVRLARGSAYGWVDVSWTDGPSAKEVGKVGRRFQGSDFDGMDDAYHSTGGPYALCGCSLHRTASPEAVAAVARKVKIDGEGKSFVRCADGMRWTFPYRDSTPEEVARAFCGTDSIPA